MIIRPAVWKKTGETILASRTLKLHDAAYMGLSVFACLLTDIFHFHILNRRVKLLWHGILLARPVIFCLFLPYGCFSVMFIL